MPLHYMTTSLLDYHMAVDAITGLVMPRDPVRISQFDFLSVARYPVKFGGSLAEYISVSGHVSRYLRRCIIYFCPFLVCVGGAGGGRVFMKLSTTISFSGEFSPSVVLYVEVLVTLAIGRAMPASILIASRVSAARYNFAYVVCGSMHVAGGGRCCIFLFPESPHTKVAFVEF